MSCENYEFDCEALLELCTLLHPILLPEIRSALLHLIVFFTSMLK